jgi:hypothetical protein
VTARSTSVPGLGRVKTRRRATATEQTFRPNSWLAHKHSQAGSIAANLRKIILVYLHSDECDCFKGRNAQWDAQTNSDGADDSKPEERERRHRQLHVGNDNPPGVLLIKAFDSGISRCERRYRRQAEAQAVNAEDDKRKV